VKTLLIRSLSGFFLLLLFSCGQRDHWPDEVSENAQWLAALKPWWKTLDEDRSPAKLLQHMDSLQRHSSPTPLSRARRQEIIADYHLFITKDYAAALGAVDSALACYPTEKEQQHYPRTYVGYLLFAGDLSYRLGKYDHANEFYFRAKRLSDERLPTCERSAFTYNVAMVLYRQQNYQQSASYFQEAFSNQAGCPDQTTARTLQQQEILSNTGLCYFQLNKYDEALAWYDKALRYAEAHSDSLGVISMEKIRGVIAGNKAKIYLRKNNFSAAEPLLKEGIALNARPGYEVAFAQEVRLDLAGLYGSSGRFDEMRTQLDSLRRDLDTLPNKPLEKEWYGLMARLSRQQGNGAAELHYYRRFEVMKDSLENAQRRLLSADILRQLSEKELQLQLAILEQSSRRRTVYMVLLGITTILAGLVIWLIGRSYRRNQKNLRKVTALNQRIRKQQKELERETARRQQLVMEAVIEAQEAERSLIGLELHDNINQVLTTVKLHNEMVMDGIGDPKQVLQRSTHYLQDCINEIRSLSKRLSAPTLGKITLCDSVGELVQSINLTGKLTIQSECGDSINALVRKEVHLAIYRIIQEALNNVLKHAAATEARVHLALQNNGSLLLLVTDNGRGLCDDTSDGIGITNMRTRAESLGGSFHISGRKGHGCRIEVSIPHATQS
jgi:signal transduction histidine kinase